MAIPWYVEFIAAGLYITLISTVTKRVSPEIGAIVYSLPWNFLLVLFFLLKDKVPIKKIMDFTMLGGVYGLMGSIIFIGSMIYVAKYLKYKNDETIDEKQLFKIAIGGSIPWILFSVILFLQN